jgi:hypothetical protein
MILTAIAVTFGLSVVVFLMVARSAPMLNDDGTFETVTSRAANTLQQDRASSL